MTQELNLTKLIAGEAINAAIKIIQAEKLDRLYCSLTGVEIGSISVAEITHCLLVDASQDSLISAEKLVDEFAIRHAIMSNGPAPSLRLYRTRNILLSVLKADETGPNRLFGYLAGRLFFESIVSERERNSFENHKAKLAFLIELQSILATLPADWHKSLTHIDEEPTSPVSKAIGKAEVSVGITPLPAPLPKIAQRCLELLIQIDGIFNLRSKLYSDRTRQRLVYFRDESNLNLRELLSILEDLESDAIIRSSKNSFEPKSNSQIVTLAVESIGWRQKRIEDLVEKIDEATEKRRIHTQSTAAHLISSLSAILENSNLAGGIQPKDKMKIESTISALSNELKVTDQRIEQTVKIANRANAESGKVQIRKGEKPLSALVELFESRGKQLDPALKAKAAELAAKRKAANTDSSKPVKRRGGRKLTIRTHSALSELFANLTMPKLPGESDSEK